jgi:hypothetical protein
MIIKQNKNNYVLPNASGKQIYFNISYGICMLFSNLGEYSFLRARAWEIRMRTNMRLRFDRKKSV